MSMQVANTILAQLGGGMFRMMTGSKDFVGSPDSLAFKVGSNCKGVNYCKITLLPSDTYKMEFGKIRKYQLKVVASESDVYFDQLQPMFKKNTGMDTSMGKIIFKEAA